MDCNLKRGVLMRYTISSGKTAAVIDSLGAELKSYVRDNKEYMWNGDPTYWKRTSPILFPFVGAAADGHYRYKGREFSMSQHGFARDMEFTLLEQKADRILFGLDYTADTLMKYPYRFHLEAGYFIHGGQLDVSWHVRNDDENTMFFSIGGHPAFICPFARSERHRHPYYLKFDENHPLEVRDFGSSGLALNRTHLIFPDNEGFIELNEQLFDHDALIIENFQCHSVGLADSSRTPYLTVRFNAPLFGIWSPPGKNAPFVCIEPWYGRCDTEGFDGDISERDFEQHLMPGEKFDTEYSIII